MKDYLEDYFKSTDSEKILKSAILCKSNAQLQQEYDIEQLKDAATTIDNIKDVKFDEITGQMKFKYEVGLKIGHVTIPEAEYANNMDIYMIAANWFVNCVNPCGGILQDRNYLKKLAKAMKMKGFSAE